jgi:hypothetical protein
VGGAVGDLQALLADVQRALGPDHPDTLTTRHNLAMLKADSGNVKAAKLDLLRLRADCDRILGTRHPTTHNVKLHLQRLQGGQGRRKKRRR